jgi:signal transduction histidine kinase
MTFRTRLLLAFAAVVAVPLVVLGFGVRREMSNRLSTQYEGRVASLVAIIEDDLSNESEAIAARLAALREALREDNRFRLAAVQAVPTERPYLLDYASDAMHLAGLSMFQIQDAAGRILSSGHFRNEYDRLDPEVPLRLAVVGPRPALVRARTPEGPVLALGRLDSLQVGGHRFVLVGGVTVDRMFLTRLVRDPDLTVSLLAPHATMSSDERVVDLLDSLREEGVDRAALEDRLLVVGALELPYVDWVPDSEQQASVLLTYPLTSLEELRRSVDTWFLIAIAATVAVVLLIAGWMSTRISRPIRELARRTEQVNLDRLDVDFASDRRDEVGALTRLLGRMVERLRGDTVRLREIERRATVGELARQVNHDVKNGLMPIRNVFRHLTAVARDEPAALPGVFVERQGTVESGIAYLERLVTNYARLYPSLEVQACDVNTVVREVTAGARRSVDVELDLRIGEGIVAINTDPLVLRRILENLVRNAMDSLEGVPGRVTVTAAPMDGAHRGVRITVGDTGKGMTQEELDHAFDDFYTTKASGTGLGLSIVRRLVADLGGALRVTTAPGEGTTFTIELTELTPQPTTNDRRAARA